MGARERTKGAVAEREVVAIFHAHGWTAARRTHDGRAQVGRGDIIAGPAGTHVEVKRHERLNVPAALDQVTADAHPADMPLLVHRPSRHPWMVTLRLDDLLPLLAMRERA